jgi:hypothetical protein
MASVAVFARPAKIDRSVSFYTADEYLFPWLTTMSTDLHVSSLMYSKMTISNSSQSTPSFYSLVKPYLLLSQVAKSMSA